MLSYFELIFEDKLQVEEGFYPPITFLSPGGTEWGEKTIDKKPQDDKTPNIHYLYILRLETYPSDPLTEVALSAKPEGGERGKETCPLDPLTEAALSVKPEGGERGK